MSRPIYKQLLITIFLLLVACVPSAVKTEPPQVDEDISTPTPNDKAPGVETPDISERRPSQTLPAGLERIETPQAEPVTGEVPAEILNEIIADLVERTGTNQETIHVIRAEFVVWNDGSLGCPKPGEFYIQILINGYWVVLEVEGEQYDYRVSDTGSFLLCEGKGQPPISPPGISPGE